VDSPNGPPAAVNCDVGAFEGQATDTPVQLTSFAAHRAGRIVALRWETASEIKNAGFRLWREGANGTRTPIGPALIPAQGGELGGATYRFTDATAPITSTRYWLEDVSTTGAATRHGPAVAPAYRWRIIKDPIGPQPVVPVPDRAPMIDLGNEEVH
jgi:hypothetical protein